jgi:Trp operon repressor
MWQPQPDLTFPHYLLGMSMVTSDTYYGEKYDMLYKLFECPNKKGFVDTQSMQQFFLTLLASLTPEERETLPQELQTVDSLMKKFQSDFRIDKKEIAKDDFITTIKIYKH